MAEVQTEVVAARRTTPPIRADHVGSQVAKLELIVETAAEVWG